MLALVFYLLLLVGQSASTSMKIDYLRMTDARVDPIVNPGTPSGHVHRFFGAQAVSTTTTYEDLRAAPGNTGNVEENLSLYWHPAIYRVEHNSNNQDLVYRLQETSQFSTYYIWPTGETRAFPDGFKMVGGGAGYTDKARPLAECVNPSPCEEEAEEEDDKKNCRRQASNNFFPSTFCSELEMSMIMPSCWDGVRLDSPNHRDHVRYPKDGDADGECPRSHPVRLPQIRMFTRIAPYKGGEYVFSDGTGHFHADYMSGWKETELQRVLDTCENDSWDAMPNDWCENFVTFRDAPKDPSTTEPDPQKLIDVQPVVPFDNSALLYEPLDNVKTLPGSNSGDSDDTTMKPVETTTTKTTTTTTTSTSTTTTTTKTSTTTKTNPVCPRPVASRRACKIICRAEKTWIEYYSSRGHDGCSKVCECRKGFYMGPGNLSPEWPLQAVDEEQEQEDETESDENEVDENGANVTGLWYCLAPGTKSGTYTRTNCNRGCGNKEFRWTMCCQKTAGKTCVDSEEMPSDTACLASSPRPEC